MRLQRAYQTIIALFFVLNTMPAYSQTNWNELPWKSYADYKLQALNKSYVTTGVLYDRVFPIANVDEHTGNINITDTTSARHFAQAYYEMYNAAYNSSNWVSPDALDSLIKYNGSSHQHPIGISLYQFNTIDSNALQDHLLDTLSNGQFVDVPNRLRSPYFNNTAFMASPLLAGDQVMEAGTHEFYLDSRVFLQNKGFTITQIRVDFGDGQGEWVVDNPFGSGKQRTQGFGFFQSIIKSILSPTLVGRIIIVGADLLGNIIQYGNAFSITVKNTKQYQPLTTCKGLQKWVIDADAAP